MNNKLTDFNEIHKYLTSLANDMDKIPTITQIDNDNRLPTARQIRRIYENNVGMNYFEYLRSLGYKSNLYRQNEKLTYEQLCGIWEDFYKENDRYPYKSDCENNRNLPTWYMVKKICGNRFTEFKSYFKDKERRVKFDYYCKVFIEESKKKGNHITSDELDSINKYSDILPSTKWFIENSPHEEIKTYKDFVKFLGFTYKDELTKEQVKRIIINKHKRLGRNLKSEDFDGIAYNNNEDIGIGVIIKHWGTFNNMLEDLGFSINQESMTIKHKSVLECVEDIIYICKDVNSKENGKAISYDDIDNYEGFNTAQSYNKIIRDNLGLTLFEFISSLGFEVNQGSMGMVYHFDNGETTVSNYEYKVSNYLRSNRIKYIRNVKYSNIVDSYNGRKDCDYVITVNDDIWYVEIAGMLSKANSIEHAYTLKLNNVASDYLNNLIEKESMLKQANVNYKILFPNDLKDLDKAFSFLHYTKLAN